MYTVVYGTVYDRKRPFTESITVDLGKANDDNKKENRTKLKHSKINEDESNNPPDSPDTLDSLDTNESDDNNQKNNINIRSQLVTCFCGK